MTESSMGPVERLKKVPREPDDEPVEAPTVDDCQGPRSAKAKRHDFEVPLSEVDARLAEKLDNLLKISDARKPRFFLHKLKQQKSDSTIPSTEETSPLKDIDKSKLKPKNLTKEELKERLLKNYDTLVPDLDPKRPTVKLIKVLSVKESLELAKGEAKKQMAHQLELNSVSGDRLALVKGTGAFSFNDGYEMPAKCFLPGKKTAVMLRKPKARKADGAQGVAPKNSAKSVKFSDENQTFNVSKHGAYSLYRDVDEDDDDYDEDSDDDDGDGDDLDDDDETGCSTGSSENEKEDDASGKKD